MKRWIQANIIAVFLIATVMLSGTADAQVPCYDANLVTIPCPTTTTTTTPPTTTPPTTTTTPPTTTTTPPTTTRTRPVITDPPRTTTTTTTEAPTTTETAVTTTTEAIVIGTAAGSGVDGSSSDSGSSEVASDVVNATVAPALVISSANNLSSSDQIPSGGNSNVTPSIAIVRDAPNPGSNRVVMWTIIAGVHALVLSLAMYRGVFRRTRDNFDPTRLA